MRGRIFEQGLVLSKHTSYNSIQTVASGGFVPKRSGTQIEEDLGVGTWVTGLRLWFPGVGAFALVGLLVFLTNAAPSEASFSLLLPVGMLIFGGAVCILGRNEAIGDGACYARRSGRSRPKASPTQERRPDRPGGAPRFGFLLGYEPEPFLWFMGT